MNTAISASQLRNEIQPAKLAAHGFPRPQRTEVVQGTDSSGETALYVYVVFADNTPEAALAWKEIEPMVRWIHQTARRISDESALIYVKVKRKKDVLRELG